MNSTLLFLGDIGTSEMVLIVVVILIFFGANKIPELARGLGKGIREFKDASNEIRNEFERAGQPTPPTTAYQQPDYQQPTQYQQPGQYHPYPQQYEQTYPPTADNYQSAPVAPTEYSAPPVADYTAPGTVISPSAEPATHHHDTPLPPNAGINGVPGSRPRLDQSHTDAS